MSAVIRYTTQDGDRWDLIAHKHYGNALLIDGLITGGLTVFVPVLETKPKNNQEELPWWMR